LALSDWLVDERTIDGRWELAGEGFGGRRLDGVERVEVDLDHGLLSGVEALLRVGRCDRDEVNDVAAKLRPCALGVGGHLRYLDTVPAEPLVEACIMGQLRRGRHDDDCRERS